MLVYRCTVMDHCVALKLTRSTVVHFTIARELET